MTTDESVELTEPICLSCPKEPYPWPARYVASAKRINDLPPTDWPVCEGHMEIAMVAGWFPILTIDEWLRARTASSTREGL